MVTFEYTGLPAGWSHRALNIHHQLARLYVNASALSTTSKSEALLSCNIAMSSAFFLLNLIRTDDVVRSTIAVMPQFMIIAFAFAGAFLLKALRMQELGMVDLDLRRENVFMQGKSSCEDIRYSPSRSLDTVQDVCTIMRSACASPLAHVYSVAAGLQELLETTSRLSMRMTSLSRPPSRTGRYQRQTSVPLELAHPHFDFFDLHPMPINDAFLYQLPLSEHYEEGTGDFNSLDIFGSLLPPH